MKKLMKRPGKELIEAAEKAVKKREEEKGSYAAALLGIRILTETAGTKNEKLYSESEIKQIMGAVIGCKW